MRVDSACGPKGKPYMAIIQKKKRGIIICWQVSGSVPVVAIQIPCQHDAEMKGGKQDGRRKLLLCDIYAHSFLRMP